jgi:hypothetical protein
VICKLSRLSGGCKVFVQIRIFLRMFGITLILAVLMLVGSQAFAVMVSNAPTASKAVTAAVPGELAVEAAPTTITPGDSTIFVRVANIGSRPVWAVTVKTEAPPGVVAIVRQPRLGSLAAHSSRLVPIAVTDMPESRPGLLVVRAKGRSNAGSTAALTSIKLVSADPIASLVLVGNTRLSDSSPADLMAVVRNLADTSIDVSLRATADQNVVRLAADGKNVARAVPGAPLTMKILADRSAVVLIQVNAHSPLRRGTTGLVVTATFRTLHGAGPSDITASEQLDVALSADILPGMIGVGSVLVIPGLVAIWAALSVQRWDRRRLGLETPSVGSQIWGNKLWLLAAAAVSLLAAVLYSAAGFANLLDAYTLGDIAVVTVLSGLLGAAASGVVVWLHRRRVPVVTPASAELTVLKAAKRADDRVARAIYRRPDGKRGLLVHSDRDAVVLTPPVEYTEMDIQDALRDDSLTQAIRGIENSAEADQHMRYRQNGSDEYIEGPCAVLHATRYGSSAALLRYADTFQKNAAP